MKWNDVPFSQDVDPEVKALEFDLQIVENGGTLEEGDTSEVLDMG